MYYLSIYSFFRDKSTEKCPGLCRGSLPQRGTGQCRQTGGILSGYGKPFDISASGPAVAVNAGAFLILGEFLFGGFHIAVDLPAADAFAVAGIVLHEAADILHRVAQKEANLVGEMRFRPDTAAEGAQTLDLTGTTLTGYLKAGDLMQIGGKNYTVVEDTAAAASNTISGVKVTPALPALTAGTAVTLIGSHTANLAFHPSAFAFVTRPLSEPAGVESYVTSFDGISLRVVRGYDMKYKREMLSMDVLYAYKTIYPELAVRCLG